jgi:hypothetical protein
MRPKNFVSFTSLGAFVVTLGFGCGQGTDVQLAPAPVETPGPTKEVPKEVKKGGGPGSSGNLKRNPGLDPLAK